MYDITVPETENFCLSSGVFVHNSIDLLQSFVGSLYNLATIDSIIEDPYEYPLPEKDVFVDMFNSAVLVDAKDFTKLARKGSSQKAYLSNILGL